jgi:membrane-bound lytic murein transglycosylase A
MKLFSRLFLLFLFGILMSCAVSRDKVFELRKVSYSSIPNWKNDDFQQVLPALHQNCKVMQNNKDWTTFCNGLERLKDASSKKIRKFIESTMTPYAVYSYGSQQGTFTGYYEASLSGSLSFDQVNKYPIYGLPEDLLSLDTKSICEKSKDMGFRYGRIKDNLFVPYLTRSEINETTLNAPALLWVDDPVDLFILHIQGSGRVETSDGVYHVGYAGNNGHPFVGIGSLLKQDNVLENGKYSMPHIRSWLKENPEKAKEYMDKNPRYIFFKLLSENEGPLGALDVALTPERSMAVDKKYIPLGALLFLNTTDPDGKSIQQLMVAQDVGGAINGPIRGDFFWGYGEEAFQKAGRMKSTGTYYMLWPKTAKVPSVF